MLPQKHFEIFDSQIAGNALELSILLPPRLFYIILNLVRSQRADLSWLLGGGGGGGRGSVRMYTPTAYGEYGPDYMRTFAQVHVRTLCMH